MVLHLLAPFPSLMEELHYKHLMNKRLENTRSIEQLVRYDSRKKEQRRMQNKRQRDSKNRVRIASRHLLSCCWAVCKPGDTWSPALEPDCACSLTRIALPISHSKSRASRLHFPQALETPFPLLRGSIIMSSQRRGDCR
jgi:hypothetical protein